MSKKYHNRNDFANKSADGGKSKQSVGVTPDDLHDDTPKKRGGPPVPQVERQPFARALAELILIFAIFFIYGAWPVPDTNEPYYVGKAMHSWKPDVLKNDTFLNSHDTHWLFYKTFGWLTLYMGLDAAVWVGRSVLWFALAFGWYRLSRVVVPIPWASVISAMIFSCFLVKFQMAGEWIIGGIEGKVFSYVFVFLGLDALARNRWNLMWVLFGMAAAYHPVVGGWAVVAGGIAWLLQRRSDRVPLKRMLLPLLIGGAISLIGVAPAIMMDRPGKASDFGLQASGDEGQESEENIEANPEVRSPESEAFNKIKEKSWYIAVFKRLSHHQLPYAFRTSWVIRLSLLTVAWLLCAAVVWGRKTIRPDDPQAVPDNEPILQPPAPPGFRIACFIVATILISCTGFIIAYGLRVPLSEGNRFLFVPLPEELPNKAVLAAKFLRFYWFRMTDFTIPLGMALCGTAILYRTIALCRKEKYPAETHWWVKTLGGYGLAVAIVFGLAFTYFTNFSSVIPTGMSYELRILESETLACGVVFIFCGFLLFWLRNDAPQPDRPPGRSMLKLLLSLVIVFGVSLPMLLDYTQKRLCPSFPRTVLFPSPNNYKSWREMCQWIDENTDKGAIFLVPSRDESFKWYAKRANVSTWKEMPQDAASMVKWYETMVDCYSPHLTEEEQQTMPERIWAQPSFTLRRKSQNELAALQEKYQFSYILTDWNPQQLNLPVVCEMEPFYILYWADPKMPNPHDDSQNSSLPPTTPDHVFSPFPSVMPSPPLSSDTPVMTVPTMQEPVTQQSFNNIQISPVMIPTLKPVN